MYRASQTLTDEQAAWVKQTTERVLKILRETPPDGELFTNTVTVCLLALSRSLIFVKEQNPIIELNVSSFAVICLTICLSHMAIPPYVNMPCCPHITQNEGVTNASA